MWFEAVIEVYYLFSSFTLAAYIQEFNSIIFLMNKRISLDVWSLLFPFAVINFFIYICQNYKIIIKN